MSDLLLCRIDPDLIYPPFMEKVQAMLAELQQNGTEFWAISGFRTGGEQMALWTQGRTRPGPIVTYAKAMESAHNFGIAVDLCRDGFIERKGLQPDWRPDSYTPLQAACKKYDLEWGGNWRFPDRPHVQLPGYVTGAELEQLAAVWNAATPGFDVEKLHAVWQYLDEEKANAD